MVPVWSPAHMARGGGGPLSAVGPDEDRLLGGWEAGFAKHLPNHPVGIEIHLPVVLVVAVWPHGQDGPQWIEAQDLDVGSRLAHDVGNLRQSLLEQRDGPHM